LKHNALLLEDIELMLDRLHIGAAHFFDNQRAR
jgi:hypothetical protein